MAAYAFPVVQIQNRKHIFARGCAKAHCSDLVSSGWVSASAGKCTCPLYLKYLHYFRSPSYSLAVYLDLLVSPRHSPGSVCYLVDGKLLSGDVLFYRTVGRTDVQNSSREDQIRSVQHLYQILPDSTPVYPGHMQFTDILSEKTLNSRIKADTVTL